MKIRSFLSLLVSVQLVCSACGSRDYPPKPPDYEMPTESRTNLPESKRLGGQRIVQRKVRTGYLWKGMNWVAVPDEDIANLRCLLADSPRVDHFKAFGTSLLGGAAIGLVIRSSGSWFFGQPIEPGPGHWFWSRFDQIVKIGGQGMVRGALFAGACQTVLAGGNLIPFTGILGQSFTALSAATALGSLSSMAVNPYVWMLMGEDPTGALRPEDLKEAGTGGAGDGPEGGSGVKPPAGAKPAGLPGQLQSLKRGVRYRLIPGIVIVGIGASIGVIVYDWLQDEDEDTSRVCAPDGVPKYRPVEAGAGG